MHSNTILKLSKLILLLGRAVGSCRVTQWDIDTDHGLTMLGAIGELVDFIKWLHRGKIGLAKAYLQKLAAKL